MGTRINTANRVELVDAKLNAAAFVRTLFESFPFQEVQQLTRCRASFPWEGRYAWGIEETAWERVQSWNIEPLLLFCHPRVLREQPHLLLYYRTAALLSQKGMALLVRGNFVKAEARKLSEIPPDLALAWAITLNSVISAVVSAASEIEPAQLPGLQFAAAGVAIQGGWNTAVGKEGEAAVRTVLVNHLREEIVQIVWKNGTISDYAEDRHASILDDLANVRIVRLKPGHHLQFGSEPDVSLRDANDVPVVSIEVKAGTDPAGALERLGAAMKSFEHDRNRNPRVKTIYVAQCITPEVRKRIEQDNPFDHLFRLSELLADEETQRTFANLVLKVVLGKARR